MPKKKLSCHCGGVEGQVEIPETGFKKIMRCNCSICKRKGYIIAVAGQNDFKITKGENLLKLYQFHSKTAKHYFKQIEGPFLVANKTSPCGSAATEHRACEIHKN